MCRLGRLGLLLDPVRRRSLVAPATFVSGSAAAVALLGFPAQRDVIGAWVIAGLLAISLAGVRGRAKHLARELVPLLGLIIAYDALRGDAKDLFPTHYLPQIQVDEALFGGSDPTVSLQHALWHGRPRWYDAALAGVYVTHFVAMPLLAAALWKLDHARFRRFIATIVTLSALGLATYALYPAAPPWLASRAGFLPHVTRIVPAVWQDLNVRFLGSLVQSGYRYANNVAAVPSLHTAFAIVTAAFLWPKRRRWLRAAVAAYPIAMGFTLVYTGEHYVFDILIGCFYASGSLLAIGALSRRHARRAQAFAVA
jgi:hypothetical protein